MTDTPDKIERAQEWFHSRGIAYLMSDARSLARELQSSFDQGVERERARWRKMPGPTELWGRHPSTGEIEQIDDSSHTLAEQESFAKTYAAAGWTDLKFYRYPRKSRSRALTPTPTEGERG